MPVLGSSQYQLTGVEIVDACCSDKARALALVCIPSDDEVEETAIGDFDGSKS